MGRRRKHEEQEKRNEKCNQWRRRKRGVL